MKTKLIIGICILFLLGINVNASTTYEEKSSIARIIGDEAFERSIKTAHDNIYMVKGADKVLGDTNIDDLAIVKAKAISQDGLAEGIKDVGRLDDVGIDLGDLNDANSWIYRLKKANNPGSFAEAKRSVEWVETSNTEVFIAKQMTVPQGNLDIDVLARVKGTNTGIIEEVKNWNQRTINDPKNIEPLKTQITKLGQAVGKNVDNTDIVVKESRIVFRDDVIIPDEIITHANNHGVDIIRFKGVD